MLNLKRMELTPKGIEVTYTVLHNVGHLPTTLDQDLELVINPDTGAVSGRMVMDNLQADSLDAAREKMAEWCDRMAAALRQPMRQRCMVPVFERLPFDKGALPPRQRHQFDALVEELVAMGSWEAMNERLKALAEEKHPLVLVKDAFAFALRDAELRLENADE